MIITKRIGNIEDEKYKNNKNIDWLEVEWEDLNKKILRQQTVKGMDISISLEDHNHLHYGDVIYENGDEIIAIRTKLEDVYVIKPKNTKEMGRMAFEIGNRHTPCIIEESEILVRYDHTLDKLMDEVGVSYERTQRRFKEPFKYRGHQH